MNEQIAAWCGLDRTSPDGRRHVTTTLHVDVSPGAHLSVASVVRRYGDVSTLVVVADPTTWDVAGAAVARALADEGLAASELIVASDDGSPLVCDDALVERVRDELASRGATHAIAVGSGTINDAVKMAAHLRGHSYTAVGTAPSMNGYTSAIAAILSDGVKTTQPCAAPVAVLADPEVMAAAPYRMIASGIGDLYSKPVSNGDWRLSTRLLGTPHSDIVMEIVEAGSALLEGVAPRLPARDVDAVAGLTGALMLSGLAMQAAGSSVSASGGEHLISHYIDMTAWAFDQPHDFHGCQVAVGTIATSTLYERVRALDPSTIDIDGLVAAHLPWDEHERALRDHFGPLGDAVIEHARRMYPDADTVRARLQAVVADWDDIFADVSRTLRPAAELEAELRSADCPTMFDEIGVDREGAVASIRWSKDIRARYTILHLAAELGVLDAFARSYVDDESARVASIDAPRSETGSISS